eukprot:g15084.t1
MQVEDWGRDDPMEGQGQEIIEELDLNTGGLVGAVTSIEGTGQLVTGTRNDESGWGPAAAAPEDNRLTVHTIRDTRGRVLGLGSSSRAGGEGAGGDDDDGDEGDGGGGWEPVVEAWVSHEAAVTGIDVAGGFGNLGGVSGVVTSGGDGRLRLFELTAGDVQYDQDGGQYQDGNGDGSAAAASPSLALHAQVATHSARATGVAATRRRAVVAGEDGAASLVDLQRLVGGGGGAGDSGGGVIWTGSATGALPLTGVTFQGESEEVFATVGCDPRAQLLVWDTRAGGSRPALTKLGRFDGSDAPYLCVASQPFTPQVFACGVSTGELLLWDVRARDVVNTLQVGASKSRATGGTWGVAFHPRRPRHLFTCTGTGLLTKWLLPAGQRQAAAAAPRFGSGGGGVDRWAGMEGDARHLYALPSRSAMVGVCYDEAADCLSAVSKHGHVVVAQGVAGLRL